MDRTIIIGGPSSLFGLSWIQSDFSEENFYLALSTKTTGITYSVDHVQIKVYYLNSGVVQDTGWKSPTSVLYSDFSDPTNGYSSNDQYTVSIEVDASLWYGGFGFSILDGVTILGIEISTEGHASGPNDLYVIAYNTSNSTFGGEHITLTQNIQTLRVSLPGYDCLTDPDPDHYAIIADEDNVLIKEFTRGSITVPTSSDPDYFTVIAHDLGYIPFFLCYVYDEYYNYPNGWIRVPSFQGVFSAPAYAAVSDANNIILYNQMPDTVFYFYIFYDRGLTSGNPTFTESDQVLKITKAGYEVTTETNPNNYIYHSDLNTLKILHHGVSTGVSITAGYGAGVTIAHGSPVANVTSMEFFIKFPDGKVVPASTGAFSLDGNYFIRTLTYDDTNINLDIGGGGSFPMTVDISWFIFETPLG